jgi:hypothetical protein
MTPAELLQSLAGRGITLSVEGEGLRARPASRLTAEDRAAVQAHKPALLAMLRPALPLWDQAEAGHLVNELRAEVSQLQQALGRPVPADLAAAAADLQAVAEGYVRHHEQEAARGWDAMGLLQQVRPALARAVENCRRQGR